MEERQADRGGWCTWLVSCFDRCGIMLIPQVPGKDCQFVSSDLR